MDIGAIIEVIDGLAVRSKKTVEVEVIDLGRSGFLNLPGPTTGRTHAPSVGIGMGKNADMATTESIARIGVKLRCVPPQNRDRQCIKDTLPKAEVKSRKQVGTAFAHQDLPESVRRLMPRFDSERPALVRTRKGVGFSCSNMIARVEVMSVESTRFRNSIASVAKDPGFAAADPAESKKSQVDGQIDCLLVDPSQPGKGFALRRTAGRELRHRQPLFRRVRADDRRGGASGHGDESLKGFVVRNAKRRCDEIRTVALYAAAEALEPPQIVEKIEGRVAVSICVAIWP